MGRGEGAGRRHTGRLRKLAPDWAAYRSINGLEIRRYLQIEHGVKVATTGHKYPVDPAAVRDAIARRETTREAADEPDGAA
jgi:S-DNA-T family DNA segregation ATPase FtsK/SpoIIIE